MEDTQDYSSNLQLNNNATFPANVTIRFTEVSDPTGGTPGAGTSRDIPVPVNSATAIPNIIRWASAGLPHVVGALLAAPLPWLGRSMQVQVPPQPPFGDDVAGTLLYAAKFTGTISVFSIGDGGALSFVGNTTVPGTPAVLNLAAFPAKSCSGARAVR